MQSKAATVDTYIEELPEERKDVIKKMRKVILKNLPKGFKETMGYGMVSYVVPHTIYPAGYHCDPEVPLPFLAVASQKNFVALYHMGMYANKELLDWFTTIYPDHAKTRLDMGKSCVRFKKMDDIPFDLIAELVSKMNVQEWIDLYEKNLKR